jgi:hypothetical protein
MVNDWSAYLPIAVAAGFVAFSLVILNFLAIVGGWQRLASCYYASAVPPGERFLFRTANVGSVGYGSCLRFISGPAGLFISVFLLFRPGHPPLFIPWSDVSASATRGWVFRYVDMRFARDPKVRLRVTRRLGERLLAAGGQRPPESA